MVGKKAKQNSANQGEVVEARKERATHFLCFPISSDTIVPELAKSIAYFRGISTDPAKTKPKRRLETTADGTVKVVNDADEAQLAQPPSVVDDPLGSGSNPVQRHSPLSSALQVLPDITHRAPGTYHLTLGVMDLSDEAKMQKAKDLLQSLDLKQILGDAERGPPADIKKAGKWKTIEAEAEGEKDAGVLRDQVAAIAEQPAKQAEENYPSNLHSLSRPVSPPARSAQQPPLPTSKEAILPLRISLTGLGAFPSGKKARVIWARPREQTHHPGQSTGRPDFNANTRLYNFALHLNHIFREEGFITETRPLVLHATVSNMRYAVQAKGSHTGKQRARTYDKKRWKDGLVDARQLLHVFNEFDGDLDAAQREISELVETERGNSDAEEEDLDRQSGQKHDTLGSGREYIWAKDIPIDRVAICKMGATKAEDELWGEWYPPISEKMIVVEE